MTPDLESALHLAIARFERQGFASFDELNTLLPPREITSTEIEDFLNVLHERGIEVGERR